MKEEKDAGKRNERVEERKNEEKGAAVEKKMRDTRRREKVGETEKERLVPEA